MVKDVQRRCSKVRNELQRKRMLLARCPDTVTQG